MLQGLINAIPDILKILIEGSRNPVFLIFIWIEVSEDKEQLFVQLLLEQLHIDIKDNFQKSVVAAIILANDSGVEVDHQDISHSKCEQRSGLFKRHSLLLALHGVCAFDVEDNDILVFIQTEPNAFCGLTLANLRVHYFESSLEQEVQERA